MTVAGNATHQAAVLGAIGRHGCAGMDALAEHLPIERRKISNAAARLIARGLVERVETGVFQLTPAGDAFLEAGGMLKSGPRGPLGAVRPRPNTFRQRAWTAMRLSQRFTVADILMLAAKPTDHHAEGNLHRFVSLLLSAGFVAALPARVRGSAPTSNGHRVYVLLRRDSEIAPTYLDRERAMRDGDTGEVVPCRRP